MKYDLSIDGLKQFDDVLKELGPALAQRELRYAAVQGSKVIQNSIAEDAPLGEDPSSPGSRKYGPLSENIRIAKRKFTRNSVEYAIHTGAAYWAYFLEFGTSKMSPQPFATRAFDRSVEPALQKIIETLGVRLPKLAAEIAGKYGSLSRFVKKNL